MNLMPILEFGDPALDRFYDRTPGFDPEAAALVARIIADVKARGEEAVLESALQFDSPHVKGVWAAEEEIEHASLPGEDMAALELAIKRVSEFHDTQLGVITEGWEEVERGWAWRTSACERAAPKPEPVSIGPFKLPVPDEMAPKTTTSGMLGQRMFPVKAAGVYVPGGKASYPSSVYMNAVPALAAGVERVIVATPVQQSGRVSDAVLVACRLLGIRDILKCGGAAAAAALAFGLGGRPRADVLVGPGSRWVNEAKRQLWGAVGLTAYAGPSEVCVLAFPGSDPVLAAADLVTQVEHAEDNVGILVAFSRRQAEDILASAQVMTDSSARREQLKTALANGCAIVCSEPEAAFEAVNRFAPEHLAIHGELDEDILGHIHSAGCIALGPWTAQSAGDYVSGPSHTLPTGGAARFGSPVSVQDFLKLQSVTLLEREDIADLAPVVARLARLEGFPLHEADAQARLRV